MITSVVIDRNLIEWKTEEKYVRQLVDDKFRLNTHVQNRQNHKGPNHQLWDSGLGDKV